jgi:hypothetical protein
LASFQLLCRSHQLFGNYFSGAEWTKLQKEPHLFEINNEYSIFM